MSGNRTRRQPHRCASDLVLTFAVDWHRRLLDSLPESANPAEALRSSHGLLLRHALEARGIERDGQPLLASGTAPGQNTDTELGRYIEALCSPPTTRALRAAPIEVLGHAYEQCLALAQHGASRKTGGIYYTPTPIVHRLVEHTVGALLESATEREPATVRVVDPACGTGAFLLGVYDRLLAAQLDYLVAAGPSIQRGRVGVSMGAPYLALAERRRILDDCIHGIDLDDHALEVARLCLYLRMIEAADPRQLDLFRPPVPRPLATNLRRADSLDTASLGEAVGAFDVVIGNPPWGQKAVDASTAQKRALQAEYPSSRGIFDWFRPFVELGVRHTGDGGWFGMVLPDIVLLKNYEPTRRLLLDQLAMTEIEWLGMAFSGATIDAVTIAGRKARPSAKHRVHVVVSDPANPVDHELRQADFASNPRCAFNLFLTKEKRAVLRKLDATPTLGHYFEVHEGIHSGNIRAELFVGERMDESCRELLFGRDELRAYSLRWSGKFVRLSAVPERRTRARYANVGQLGWYEQPKLLVRRTGDRITAAVEPHRRFASNNFFVVIPRRDHPLSLHGLCAALNSSFMTWLFRTIEPRKGRAFAEVKIKHLVDLPVPAEDQTAACELLNQLGAERHEADTSGVGGPIDARIDAAVADVFGVSGVMSGAFGARDTPARAD